MQVLADWVKHYADQNALFLLHSHRSGQEAAKLLTCPICRHGSTTIGGSHTQIRLSDFSRYTPVTRGPAPRLSVGAASSMSTRLPEARIRIPQFVVTGRSVGGGSSGNVYVIYHKKLERTSPLYERFVNN